MLVVMLRAVTDGIRRPSPADAYGATLGLLRAERRRVATAEQRRAAALRDATPERQRLAVAARYAALDRRISDLDVRRRHLRSRDEVRLGRHAAAQREIEQIADDYLLAGEERLAALGELAGAMRLAMPTTVRLPPSDEHLPPSDEHLPPSDEHLPPSVRLPPSEHLPPSDEPEVERTLARAHAALVRADLAGRRLARQGREPALVRWPVFLRNLTVYLPASAITLGLASATYNCAPYLSSDTVPALLAFIAVLPLVVALLSVLVRDRLLAPARGAAGAGDRQPVVAIVACYLPVLYLCGGLVGR
jgi:hypothetical protein